jgi:hypothetical protein
MRLLQPSRWHLNNSYFGGGRYPFGLPLGLVCSKLKSSSIFCLFNVNYLLGSAQFSSAQVQVLADVFHRPASYVKRPDSSVEVDFEELNICAVGTVNVLDSKAVSCERSL